MKTKLLAYLGLIGLIVLIAMLVAARDILPSLAVKLLIVLLGLAAIALLYLLYWLYSQFHKLHIEKQTRAHELKAAQQQLTIDRERWSIEKSTLLLAQQLQVSRIYPNERGHMPLIVRADETGQYQYVQLPHATTATRQSNTRVTEADAPALPEQASSLHALPVSVRYEEIQSQVPRGRSCLGVSENGVETCDFGQLMTMWICGGSSTGKSNTVALKIDEAIRNGRNIGIILVDPHARKEDSLYNKIRCYERFFLRPVAQNERDIRAALEWFKAEFERRLEQGGQGQTDILLVVDEVSNVVESDDEEIGKLIKKIARICGQESRGFGMFGWFISQDAAGLAWLRKRAMTVIAHKLNMMSERKLACNEDLEIARSMDHWPRGRVAVYGLNFQGVMVTQMPAFASPTIVESDPVTDEMEPLQPRSAFRSSGQKRDAETLPVSANETHGEAASDGRKILAFRVSEQEAAASTKKETAAVSDETKKTILRMYRANLPLREIARFVGLSGEKYSLFKQACAELGIQPGQVIEG